MQELAGKVAVVTGAASGIGFATARAFAQAGMKVALVDIEVEALAKAEAELAGTGAELLCKQVDVSRAEEVDALAEQVEAHFGAVHVAFNNAGVMVSGPAEILSLQDWEWVMGVDLWGVIHGVRAFLPAIKRAGEGHIVNTASTAGLYAGALIGPYNVAKFGVVALSETVQRELDLAEDPIGVSVLCPGAVDTRIAESERNRSQESLSQHVSTPQGEAMKQGAQSLLASQGLPADRIAEIVLEGIRERRFWLLPHTDWIDILADRVEGMRSGGELRSGFGG